MECDLPTIWERILSILSFPVRDILGAIALVVVAGVAIGIYKLFEKIPGKFGINTIRFIYGVTLGWLILFTIMPYLYHMLLDIIGLLRSNDICQMRTATEMGTKLGVGLFFLISLSVLTYWLFESILRYKRNP